MKDGRFFKHDDYVFLFELTLGASYRGGSDVGECLVTSSRNEDSDPESWYREWKATADRIAEEARRSEGAGHGVSARAASLRAATYYDTASFFLNSTKDPSRLERTWESHREAWDRAAALRRLRGPARVQPGRGSREDRPPASCHRPRGRAVLAGPVKKVCEAVAGPKELVRFTAEEGADGHCEPEALALREQRLFDWLDARLGVEAPRAVAST